MFYGLWHYQTLEKVGEIQRTEKTWAAGYQKEKLKGKLHEFFEPSFDWKMCDTENFVDQKLDYIHENPCRDDVIPSWIINTIILP